MVLQFDGRRVSFVVLSVIKQLKERYSIMKKVLVIAAVVSLVLATLGVTVSYVAFLPLGLALYVGSKLL